jgi:hypothetical protein
MGFLDQWVEPKNENIRQRALMEGHRIKKHSCSPTAAPEDEETSSFPKCVLEK